MASKRGERAGEPRAANDGAGRARAHGVHLAAGETADFTAAGVGGFGGGRAGGQRAGPGAEGASGGRGGGGSGGLNLAALKPGRVVQLLNSTPLGTVVKPARFGERRLEAGMRVAAHGDLNKVNLLRYVAWRFDRVHSGECGGWRGGGGGGGGEAGGKAGESGPSGYDAHRERSRSRNERMSLLGRDIGPVPEVADPVRRAAAAVSFRAFCESYLGDMFTDPWSEDHLRAIAKIERAVLQGGLFALAMPRGSGKSCLIRAAAVWALVFGHRRFVACIAADEQLASDILTGLQTMLDSNDLLLADLPEVCFPIHAMGRTRQRAKGQLCMGRHTLTEWSSDGIVLPTIEGAAASGAVVRVASITGRLRGFNHHTHDRKVIRPDLILIDDPQTNESARSVKQCQDREKALVGAIQGLAGPGASISGLMACTVIERGDLADRMLDPAIHPQWQGERCRMVISFPEDQDLWDQYAKLRQSVFASGLSPQEVAAACNEFYQKNRAAMDAGGSVSWEHRRLASEVSALQHAMNKRIDAGEEVFFAEFQNDPGACELASDDSLHASDITGKLTQLARGVPPPGSEQLTAFIDVQGRTLFYMVVAWRRDMTGAIVDYGCEPEQSQRYFTLREIKRTLLLQAPGAGLEAAVYAGLDRLVTRLLGRAWAVHGGGELRVERCLIDAGWVPDLVYEFCRASPYAALLTPSKGVGLAAGKAPIGEWTKQPGDRVGLNWKIPAMLGRRQCRHVLFDANWWKSCVAARLKTARMDRGALYLNGQHAEEHRMLVDHLTSERPSLVTANGRSVMQWQLATVGRDNHWWDCLVGATVAANMLGVTPPGIPRPQVRKRVSLGDLAAAARNRRTG